MFIMQMSPPLSYVLMIMDSSFLRLLNADFYFDARLLQVFIRRVLMELRSYQRV